MLWKLARKRGFTPKGKTTDEKKTDTAAAEGIQQIATNQEQTMFLTERGGTLGAGLTLEALAEMPEAEFNKRVAGLTRSQLRKLMGE
jgi:hypothetical protein